jgi:hypothetical protein
VFELYEEQFRAWMAVNITAETQKQLPAGGIEGAGPAAEFAKAYTEAMFEVMQRTTLTSLALVLPFALLMWLMFRGPRLNFAEALVFALYSMGTGLFLHSIFITPLLAADYWDAAQAGGMALFLALPVWMAVAYFGASVRNVLRAVFAVLGGFVSGLIAIYVVVGVVVAMRLLGD